MQGNAEEGSALAGLDGTPEPELAGTGTIEAWRTTLLHKLVQYAFAAGMFAIAVVVAQQGMGTNGVAAMLALTVFGIGMAAVIPRNYKRSKATVFAISMLTGVVLTMVQQGIPLPNTFVGPILVLVVLALALPPAYAWSSLCVYTAVIVSVGFYLNTQDTVVARDLLNPLRFSNLFRTAGIFAGCGAAIIAAITFMTRKLESTIRRNNGLIANLRNENQAKLDALEAQRRLESQLRQARQLEALGHLAAGIAHDFNNLLVVILNNASFAQQDWTQLAETPNPDLDDIQAAGMRAAALTQQLLMFGASGVSEHSHLDFAAATSSSIDLLKRLLPSNILLTLRVDKNAGIIEGSRVELDQILLNLCVNARDAMPDGGNLEIRVSRVRKTTPDGRSSNSFACLEVQDSGEGMSLGTRERLFEPFFTTKESGKGTGMGLSVVHGAVQQHKGMIEVESNAETGSTFRVLIPLASATVPGSPIDHASDAPENVGGSETLLVVDDDAGVRKILKHLLESAGYNVLLCEHGREALEFYRKNAARIQLVMTDAVMPHMGGRELHDRIQEGRSTEEPRLPFLFCSGYASGTLPAGFFEHPLRMLIAKPFAPGAVLKGVRTLLDTASTSSP